MLLRTTSLKITQQCNSLKITTPIGLVLFNEKQRDCHRWVGYKIRLRICDTNHDGDEKERDRFPCILASWIIQRYIVVSGKSKLAAFAAFLTRKHGGKVHVSAYYIEFGVKISLLEPWPESLCALMWARNIHCTLTCTAGNQLMIYDIKE